MKQSSWRASRWRTGVRWARGIVAWIALGAVVVPGESVAQERAYELVTPPYVSTAVRYGGGLSTPDGEMVCFNAENSVAGAPLNGNTTFEDGYCARRTPSGWKTEWVTGPAPSGPRRGNHGSAVAYLSPDGQRIVFNSDVGIVPDWPGGGPATSLWGAKNSFLYEGGETRWLTPSPTPLRDPETPSASDLGFGTTRVTVAVSEDLRHGIFASKHQLVPEDQNELMDLYEWTPEGIRVVSADSAGVPSGGFAPLTTDPAQRTAAPGAVSADGSRIFFLASGLDGTPTNRRSVFMREGDELKLISPRREGETAQHIYMQGAYADGTVVYLTTTEQLTDDPKACPSCDALYRYDVEDEEMTLVATDAAGVAFLGASDDGEMVVYRTMAAIPELIVRRNGVDTVLGELSALDSTVFFDTIATVRPDKRGLRIASDGSSFVFASFATFDGAPGTGRQVFRWTPDGGVEWISRDSAGTATMGFAAIGNYSTAYPAGFPISMPRHTLLDIFKQGWNSGRVITDDGSRVFFETQDALVAEDVNGVVDVYEWHDGELSLVSPGTQSEDALYHDSSADGSTVFFTTRARLIPELDRGPERDLYAARVGGGFPLPPIQPECEGDACQGPPPGPGPQAKRSATTSDRPGGNAAERPAPARFSLRGLTARQRRALVAGRAATIRVRVTSPGVVRGVLIARARGKRIRVGYGRRLASRPAQVRVPIRLSRRGRVLLRQRGKLRLSLRVTHSKSKRIVRKVVVLHG